MPLYRSFRFQLRLKPAQERTLRRASGSLRWIWNKAIQMQEERYAAGQKYASYVDMTKWLTAWRNDPQTCWLAENACPPQQQVLKRLDEAYRRFFSKAGGHPQLRRRGQEPGLRYPSTDHFKLDAANGRLQAMKIGWMRIRQSRAVEGEIRNLSLRREGGKWYCSIQVEQPSVLPAAGLEPSIGLDLGVVLFAAGSDGWRVEPLQKLKLQQARLRRYQRAVSRKKKGSANRRKAVAKLAALHRQTARQRADWLHKLSTDLANHHPVIAIEDLKIAAMTASARGTPERPGTNVRAKARLNNAIRNAGWGEFGRQLEYKLQARGGDLVRVPARYTSQACSNCGHIDKDNRSTQARFECLACGHADNADVNAAKNILAAGHAVWAKRKLQPAACGGAVRRANAFRRSRAAPVKQEPTEGVHVAGNAH